MKMRISKNNLASFLCGGVVCLTACISMGSNDVEKVIESRPVVSSMTLSPDVPSSVPFCGKLIDITRYDMREAYDRELSSFTYFHSTTMLLIKRANRYFPVIEPILKANGIPDDFKYLAVIESHLDPRVSSPARAVGMWQLLEGTAREYGLTITPTVDERCHVEKATGAACRYLKAAYKKYGDWAAVAASYNGGLGRISAGGGKNINTDRNYSSPESSSESRSSSGEEVFSCCWRAAFWACLRRASSIMKNSAQRKARRAASRAVWSSIRARPSSDTSARNIFQAREATFLQSNCLREAASCMGWRSSEQPPFLFRRGAVH